MTDLQAIAARSSRRAYTGPVPVAAAETLRGHIARANRAGNLAIRLVEDGGALFGGFSKSYGLFSGVQSFLMMAGGAQDPDLYEKLGYYGEKLVLEITKLGLGSCWVGGTFNKKRLARTLKGGQQLVAAVTLGPVPQKLRGKEALVQKVAHRGGKTAKQMASYDAPPPDWFWQGMEAVALAPSAMHRQPVHITYMNERVNASVDGKGLELIDLGIAKYHFEVAAGGSFALGNGAAFAPLVRTEANR